MDEMPNGFSRRRKAALAGLAVFSVLIVVLWVLTLRDNIYGPFFARLPKSALTNTAPDAASKEAQLRNQDTDKDGLSDWDEANIYETSPYLEDSDSDGIADGAEIKAGTNPNCHEGQSCGPGEAAPAGGSQDNTDQVSLEAMLSALESNPGTAAILTKDQVGSNADALQAVMAGSGDAATLRQLLLTSGMPADILASTSDEELLKIYQETLDKQ